MGRHGKNMTPWGSRRPLTKEELEGLLTPYEKHVLSVEAKKDMCKKITDTCMAACAHILLYHPGDIGENIPPDERLKVFHGLVDRVVNEKLDIPDERQQFAEWYWSACTGSALIRATDEKEYKMAKKYQQELSLALKKHIDANGYDMNEICTTCNISKGSYYNAVGGGACSKKVFDAVAEAVNFEMDDDIKEMYKARFNVGNNTTERERRIERFEEISLEVEAEGDKKAAELEPARVDPAPAVAEEPAEVTADAAKEQQNTVKNEETAADERPYLDAPEMYAEATPSNTADDLSFMTPEAIMHNLTNYKGKLPELKNDLETMKTAVENLEKFIKILEILG